MSIDLDFFLSDCIELIRLKERSETLRRLILEVESDEEPADSIPIRDIRVIMGWLKGGENELDG